MNIFENEDRRRRRQGSLRARLVAMDVAALALAAGLAQFVTQSVAIGALPILRLALFILVGLALLARADLYKASRSSMRTVESTAIAQVGVKLGLGLVLLDTLSSRDARWGRAIAIALLSTLLVFLGRSLFRAWLRARRMKGEFLRPVVLVGADAEALRINRLLADHPDSGFVVSGVYADLCDESAPELRHLHRGNVAAAADAIRDGDATGAIVVGSALETGELNLTVRSITNAGGHVHIAAGLHGMASDRIYSEPIAHEPLLHIHPTALARDQAAAKRAVDVVLAAFGLAVAAPVILTAMAATRLADGKPALFRQQRVGRAGRHFSVLKIRTMVHDAQDRLDEVTGDNFRSGPLFKLDNDPRVTRLGRFLRATSIDELPQLWNVLRGEMSLVGPRPALPSEVAQFPPELASRVDVLPGVTGLWQIECRDSPSFDAYARLDLFYVENWTVTFDLVILLATLESELSRMLARLLGVPRGSGAAAMGRPATHLEIELELDLTRQSSSPTLVD